jgi:hypothetical protein
MVLFVPANDSGTNQLLTLSAEPSPPHLRCGSLNLKSYHLRSGVKTTSIHTGFIMYPVARPLRNISICKQSEAFPHEMIPALMQGAAPCSIQCFYSSDLRVPTYFIQGRYAETPALLRQFCTLIYCQTKHPLYETPSTFRYGSVLPHFSQSSEYRH